MKKIYSFALALSLGLSITSCSDYLNTSSPSNADDTFVTSTVDETFKILSWAYAEFRQNGIVYVLYSYNDPVGSDAEMYPEENSTNNLNAILQPEKMTISAGENGFNSLYNTIARASKVASLVAEKTEYKEAISAGKANDWTQLYGEAMTLRALAYFTLIKHFGDVPYGYENKYVEGYELTSRFTIYDDLIKTLKKVEPFMYKVGENNLTAERLSRTFADALIGELALYAGGYQTVRTDVDGLYGDVQFTTKGKEEYKSKYVRRTDYLDYYKIAEEWFQKSMDNAGTVKLITSDDRDYANNPFQRHFQYMLDLQISPESLFEVGNIQGGQAGQSTTNEYAYAFGRPSAGGNSNAAPTKAFGAIRILPTFYYGEYDKDDKRRDASITVTGSKGDGNEAILSFKPGSKLDGGISINKWDENRMNPPYVAASRQAGINIPILRMADLILMQAEVKAELGKSAEALQLVNEIRERAYGDTSHNLTGLSGQALKDAILEERKKELVGEGTRRWDLIRNGIMSERAVAVQSEMKQMINDLKSQGYHRFANGNVISNYIWVKKVQLSNPLTYDCTDTSNPALFPGWRGQYDYSKTEVSGKVKGTEHNVAIQGLFEYIDPNGAKAKTLEAEGYTKTNWGIDIVNNESSYERNILSGITSADTPPRYFFPIPFETLSQSKGKITNGYGLAQQ